MKTIQSLSAFRYEDHSFGFTLDFFYFRWNSWVWGWNLMYRQFICCKCNWLIAPTGSWVVLTGLCPSIILHYLQLSAPPSLLPSHSSDRSFPKLSLWSSYALVLGSVRYEQLSIYAGTAPVMNARGRGSEEHKAQFFFISLRLPRYITALQGKDGQERLAQLLVIPNSSSFYQLGCNFCIRFLGGWGGGMERIWHFKINVGKKCFKKSSEGSFCALQI